jgi:hypothetical protein
MKKILKRYKNLGYASALFFYIDLITICGVLCLSSAWVSHQIKQDAQAILETPDLTGMEPLELAVQQDLQDLEQKYKG